MLTKYILYGLPLCTSLSKKVSERLHHQRLFFIWMACIKVQTLAKIMSKTFTHVTTVVTLENIP